MSTFFSNRQFILSIGMRLKLAAQKFVATGRFGSRYDRSKYTCLSFLPETSFRLFAEAVKEFNYSYKIERNSSDRRNPAILRRASNFYACVWMETRDARNGILTVRCLWSPQTASQSDRWEQPFQHASWMKELQAVFTIIFLCCQYLIRSKRYYVTNSLSGEYYDKFMIILLIKK